MIASSINTALLGSIGGDPDVKLLDAFGLVDDVVTFRVSNATDACCSASHLSPWALRVAAKSAVQSPSTTRGSAYPFGPGVTGIKLGRSGTGVSAGRDAAERAS